jgi:hypothetical protein
MVASVNKEDYKRYSKSEKRFYWGFLIVGVCAASLLLSWKPYISPLLKMISPYF